MPAFEIKITMPELPKTIAAFEAEPTLRLTMINDTLRACDKILTPAIKAETPVISGKLQKTKCLRSRRTLRQKGALATASSSVKALSHIKGHQARERFLHILGQNLTIIHRGLMKRCREK